MSDLLVVRDDDLGLLSDVCGRANGQPSGLKVGRRREREGNGRTTETRVVAGRDGREEEEEKGTHWIQ